MKEADARILARELRAIREDPPMTVGEALPRYRVALKNARRYGASADAVLLIGEILWMSLRPESEPAPDDIGEALDVLWGKRDEVEPCSPQAQPKGDR